MGIRCRWHELRQGVAGGGEYGQPLAQAGEPQEIHHLRLGREEAMMAAGPVGLDGDPDQRTEPAEVTERHVGQVDQQHPAAGVAVVTLRRAGAGPPGGLGWWLS